MPSNPQDTPAQSRFMRRLFFGLLGVWFLSACQTPPTQSFPEISWHHHPRLLFHLGEKEIIAAPGRKIAPPYVGYLFPVSPARAANIWANTRLAVDGNSPGTLRCLIHKAEATVTPLAVDQSLGDYFVDEQSERYIVEIAMEILILDETGKTIKGVRANAGRSQTLPESQTLIEREKIWFDMVEGVMKDINRRLEQEIRTHLGDYLLKPS